MVAVGASMALVTMLISGAMKDDPEDDLGK